MADRSHRHSVEMAGDTVVKRFRAWDRGEHEREWRALLLLAEHAAGLAPSPIRARLHDDPPTVVMSRVDGTPLRGGRLGEAQVTALARAVDTLHRRSRRENSP